MNIAFFLVVFAFLPLFSRIISILYTNFSNVTKLIYEQTEQTVFNGLTTCANIVWHIIYRYMSKRNFAQIFFFVTYIYMPFWLPYTWLVLMSNNDLIHSFFMLNLSLSLSLSYFFLYGSSLLCVFRFVC